jgi:hypothetical protein
MHHEHCGAPGNVVIKTLHYKLEGRCSRSGNVILKRKNLLIALDFY